MRPPALVQAGIGRSFAPLGWSSSIDDMNRLLLNPILPTLVAVVGTFALGYWFNLGPAVLVEARVPEMDRPKDARGVSEEELEPTPEPGQPVRSDGQPSQLPGLWPCFRGENRDAIGSGDVPLAREWPPEGPEVLWEIELGPGHAGAAVSGGCVYVLDYDPEALADTMRCLSLADGREIWRNGYPTEVVENHGMSRTVPAVVGDCVISLGPKCHVACWDTETGQCRWLIDLVREYGTKVPSWYAGQCPLVDGGLLILAPCGDDAFLIAVDPKSGEVVWKTPKLRNWEMTHVSVVPMEFAGTRMYVYCGSGGIAGVSADNGSLLWDSTDWVGRMATCPSPVVVGDGTLFLTSGYSAGAMMLQLTEQGDRLAAETLFRLKPKRFESEQQTPVFYNDHLFGVRTKPGGEQLACLDLDGNEVWNSGEDKFGRGPHMIADGLIYLLDDKGVLTMAEATRTGYRRLGRATIFEHGHDAWGPMALAAGRLIVRDLSRMACLKVGEE